MHGVELKDSNMIFVIFHAPLQAQLLCQNTLRSSNADDDRHENSDGGMRIRFLGESMKVTLSFIDERTTEVGRVEPMD